MKLITFFYILISVTFSGIGIAQQRTNPLNQDEELGRVSWYRDYEVALNLSAKHNKPVFILFQEVPGCATCRNYGHNVLSHPLMTETIENEFIPLVIFNNKNGKDSEILKRYNEPSWNNPVVRIVDSKGKDLVKRIAGDYSSEGVYQGMMAALNNFGTAIPLYVKILGEELSLQSGSAICEAEFTMYCFWTGEKELGKLNGVLSTKAGYINGEAVKVLYDADIISKNELSNFALKNNMKPVKSGEHFNFSKKDEDYYLRHSEYRFLPLSEIQKTKINSALGLHKDPQKFLSPKQKEWLLNHKKLRSKELYATEFSTAWIEVLKQNSHN